MYNLVTYPNPILKQRCEPFDFEKPQVDLDLLLTDMERVLEDEEGFGLAAPQVGVALRIFLINGATTNQYNDKKQFEPMVFINPTVTPVRDMKVVLPEGCLSFPAGDGSVDVERPLFVKVEAFDRHGKSFTIDCSDGFQQILDDEFVDESNRIILSRVIQHENDHLDGVTLLDRVKGISKEMFKRKLRKYRS